MRDETMHENTERCEPDPEQATAEAEAPKPKTYGEKLGVVLDLAQGFLRVAAPLLVDLVNTRKPRVHSFADETFTLKGEKYRQLMSDAGGHWSDMAELIVPEDEYRVHFEALNQLYKLVNNKRVRECKHLLDGDTGRCCKCGGTVCKTCGAVGPR